MKPQAIVMLVLMLCGTALADAPRVVKATPDNGETDVDPATKEIRVEFDQPMNTKGGWSIVGGGETYPKLTAKPKWINNKTMSIPVKLEPTHEYWLSINSDTFQNFTSAKGEAAEPYPISFKTAAAGAATKPAKAAIGPDANRKAIVLLRKAIDRDYSYRDRSKVDWAKELEARQAKLEAAKSANEFAREAAELLRLAKDAHVGVKAGDTTIGTHSNPYPPNFNLEKLAEIVPNWNEDSSGIVTGKFEDSIGYIAIPAWTDEHANAFDKLISRFKDAKGLILDVRMNGGGDEIAARKVAGRFITKPTVYSKNRIRENGKWNGPFDRVVEPRDDAPRFEKPVAVLIGRKCASSNESFVLMMKHGANATLVGEPTKGSSGRPMPHDLGNGVTVYLSSWEDKLPDGTLLEGAGAPPDVPIKATADELSSDDPVLQAALKKLRS